VALQIFVELALSNVIVSLTSHEWSKLSIGPSGGLVGDASALSRLANFAGFVVKWYTGVTLLFILGIGVAGFVFLSQSHTTAIIWQAPWWTVVVFSAIQLWLMPALLLLEGCNQVVELNRFRLGQAIAEVLTLWLLVAGGAGLWAAAGLLAVRAATTLLFLSRKYRRFLLSLASGAGRERIRWREDVWPMQWRLAAQGAVNYLVFSLYVPVMFHYHGAVAAGQMGMTLQVAAVVQTVAFTWVQTRVPRFGMLVAQRDFVELDRIWWHASKLSFGLVVAGSLLVWVAVLILGELNTSLASRMLSPLPTAMLLIAYALLHISGCQAAYLRAHAREPFAAVGVLTGLLNGVLVFLCGSMYGPTGAAASFMVVIGVFVLPFTTLIWRRRRSEWQTA
jgi:O-antigen/teichoic acid export membrane protein